MAIIKGSKTKFRIGADIVAHRVSISGVNVTVGKWDATDLDSDNVVQAPTLPDPGEVTITYNVDLSESVHVDMLNDIGVEKAMSIEYPTGETNKFLNFRGWMSTTNIGESNPTNYAQGTSTITLVTLPAWGSSAVTS
ncbi:hypothetical protein [Anatilimnocola floriformis]|uniref:hypothetical protein n=1 Tax=Anatilimnocola floriformis TaxID=2948575 RepID=UPI0020C3D7BB|nr:hypothetical protein [Anatilimnocola floriformis]